MRPSLPVVLPLTLLLTACQAGSATSGVTTSAPVATVIATRTIGAPASTATAGGVPTLAAPASTTGGAPIRITKVLAIVEENHSLIEMRTGMPYLYGIARTYGYATDYRAERHPSLPNYLAIAGGSTFGVTDDEDPSAHRLPGPSVFGQTLSAGGTARLYAEALPAPCSMSSRGAFAVRHTPWAYFLDERSACLGNEVPAGTPAHGSLAADIATGQLPTTGMLIPDLEHDAHDGTLAQADNWLKGWLPPLMAGPDFRAGRLAIVVTADEDDHTAVNTLLTVVIAKGLTRHVVTTPLTHYSLTRFYDDVAGATPLRMAAAAPSLGQAFGLRER